MKDGFGTEKVGERCDEEVVLVNSGRMQMMGWLFGESCLPDCFALTLSEGRRLLATGMKALARLAAKERKIVADSTENV
eukprot:699054-Rhodomonas_salina.2